MRRAGGGQKDFRGNGFGGDRQCRRRRAQVKLSPEITSEIPPKFAQVKLSPEETPAAFPPKSPPK